MASTARYEILTHLHCLKTPGRAPVPLPLSLSLPWLGSARLDDGPQSRGECSALPAFSSWSTHPVSQPCCSLPGQIPASVSGPFSVLSYLFLPLPRPSLHFGPGEMTLWLPCIPIPFYFVASYLNSCSFIDVCGFKIQSQHL